MTVTIYNPDQYDIVILNKEPPGGGGLPLPLLVPFPSGYTVPVGPELAFGDAFANTGAQPAASWVTHDDRVGGGWPDAPGAWWSNHSGHIPMKHSGGDWYDRDGTEQGTVPYSASTIAYGTRGNHNEDVTALVDQWCAGVHPNYGFMLLTPGRAALTIGSRFDADPTKRPTLTVNGTAVPCARSTWLVASQAAGAGIGNAKSLQISSIGRTILWFDLAGFNGVKITTAILSLNVFNTQDGPWPMTLQTFRLWNNGDQTTMPSVDLGLSKDYVLDRGIDQHPSVLHAQNFEDPVASAAWLKDTGGIRMTAPDANCPSLPGGLPVVRATFKVGIMSAFQKLLPLPEGTEEGWFRYLWLPGLDFNPLWNPSGKLCGWDMSYYFPLRFNMGVGHGSSGTRGLVGESARMSFDSPITGDDPLAGFVPVGHGGCYNAHMYAASGSSMWFGGRYINLLRKGEWAGIQSHIKMNSVDYPLEIPRLVTSLTCDANGLATATFKDPQTGPLWADGIWSFDGGSWSDSSVNYCGPKTIKVISPTQCQFQVPIGTKSPGSRMTDSYNSPVPYFLAQPGQGRKDGILELKINGMLAGIWTNMCWRHARLRPDGGVHGLDNAWVVHYTGGRNPPTFECSSYFAAFLVGTEELGPLMVAP